ncbi:50S ribosomal protein L23P [Acidilobus saccharovorans 345-15]|uniref:Large ribosomal subunit protein uL23 n=1 Tax=Acidilobus saccharovorans (strain DSM 16705 / JCM 18335 / VKM B-2471 / 345-15) TaxID=666510 RepID=D9Q201_ACIS3|nr:50S ribosomal protein L23 [Acidilobus saccharovorans]ADL19339.1 50S ribosomal protein L23P [Acidilobus saccharovorans 345-15]
MSSNSREIILRAVMSEKAMSLMEKANTLVLIVARDANKPEIKRAVESLFGVKVQSVNTLITPTGEKKAYVRLSSEYKASDVAAKLGLI